MTETDIKKVGNDLFSAGDFVGAAKEYERVLRRLEKADIPSEGCEEKLRCLKNLGLCATKREQWSEAGEWCSRALEMSPNDIKSIYRRSVAYVNLQEWNKAHSDARRLIMFDKKSVLYQNHMASIERQMKTRIDESQSYVGRVNSMFTILKESSRDDTTLLQSINNLSVLAKERANNVIWTHKERHVLLSFCDMSKSLLLIEAAIRCLSVLSSNSMSRSTELFNTHGPQYFANMIYSSNSDHCRLAGLYLEHLLAGMTQIRVYKEKRDKHEAERKENRMGEFSRPYQKYKLDESVTDVVNECLHTLVKACNSKKLSASGRDSIMEILVRFIPSVEGINWSRKFVLTEGALQKVLEVGAASHKADDLPGKGNTISLIETSTKTKMTVAILLAQVYDDLLSDQDRDKFRDTCCDFVMDLFSDEIIESKVEAANLIGLFFQGPFDVGTAILGRTGILEGLLLLVNSDIQSYQRIGLDAIVLATSKKDKCMAIVTQAVPILEEIYRTGSDSMKIRALVGMCKLGVVGGRDCSIKSLADGSNLELAKSCRRYLSLSSKSEDKDMVRWAAEGLVFLTLDAEVKEAFIEDDVAVDNLLKVTKIVPLECLYPICTILVNLTNSYDKTDIMPEMIELAKYAKQHIPETHEKDNDKYVSKRIEALVRHQLPSALFNLCTLAESSHNSQSASKEMLARVYLALVTPEVYRGAVIQAGGGKSLISLALKNTDNGKVLAAQALAKLAITMDPRVAFPGQRSLEVIRPLLQLLKIENTGLQNYESLLALTNLASLDDSHRKKIVNEKGISPIENYMFEEHDMLRKAATECMCNLVQLEDVRDKFLSVENDRVKLLVLFCAEVEDLELIKAASGTLAALSFDSRCIQKITKVNNWFDILQTLLACDNRDIQHRGAYILRNMITHGGKDFCEFIVKSNMLEVLMAVSKLELSGMEHIKKCAEESLEVLVNHNLIQSI